MNANPRFLAILLLSLCLCTTISVRASHHEEPPSSALDKPDAHAVAVHDLAILGARVIDPETNVDAVLNVGIRNGIIKTITAEPLQSARVIDGRGQVLSPGFIDIHSHSPTLLGQHLSLLDGVTTQLDLEAGAWPVTAYGDHFTGGAQLNYGASVSHAAVRWKVINGIDQPYVFVGTKPAQLPTEAWTTPATDAQLQEIRRALEAGLRDGGLGIGVLLDYMKDAIRPEELRLIFETAGAFQQPVTVHVRRGMPGDPDGLDEVLALALETKAPTLICHITHSAMGGLSEWLAKIDSANVAGARVTTETLSWPAGGTGINADVFRLRDWRAIFDIDYSDVQWVETGEWLTEETFKRYQQEQPYGMVNHHYVKEAWIEQALRWPDMIVSSDALPAMSLSQKTNPNIAGTYSRLLGHYARDRSTLSLMEAIARATINPARWLEKSSDIFKRKGRLQIGTDADLVLFDPEKIMPGAAYGDPYQPSVGIGWVIVGGEVIVANGQRIEGHYPGKRLLNRTDKN